LCGEEKGPGKKYWEKIFPQLFEKNIVSIKVMKKRSGGFK
jgi:hypothetical protein